MRDASATAKQIIASDVRGVSWVADLYYNGERRAKDVQLAGPELTWDAGSQVVGSGGVTVIWADDFGKDLSPRYITDWFAPFGAELQVDIIVAAGSFQERIPMGRYVITRVPEVLARTSKLPVSATAIPLELRDILHRVGRNKFAFPTPPSSTSTWSEVQWLTSAPVVRNVADAYVAPSVVYEDSRLDAIDSLFDLMGAWPMVTPQGAITARPYTWPAAVDTVTRASVVSNEMRSENVYNRVVVEGKAPDDSVIRAIADVESGPLRTLNTDGTPSPYGIAPYFYSSDFITTQAQAQQTAVDMLARVSRLRAVTRTFSEPINPLREVGDVIVLNGETVRVSRIKMAGAESEITVEVKD